MPEKLIYWAVVPAADGGLFEVVSSDASDGNVWKPLLDHECAIGGPHKTHEAAVDAATQRVAKAAPDA